MLFKSCILLIALLLTSCSSEREVPLYGLKLTQNSLNALNAKTPFALHYITPIFPGFDVKTFKNVSADGLTLFRVYYHGKEWFQIEPTQGKKSIKKVYILSDKIEHKCRVGTKKLCRSNKNIHYIYNADNQLESIVLEFHEKERID